MTSFAPEAFGKYYLVDKLAVGGMAEIFKAKSFSHGGFEKLLVIKRILGHLSDNLEFIEMFIDEAKISVTLQHPNIVQIYDFGKIRDNYFIAMECVEGKDVKGVLRKLAERRKLLPIEFAVYIAHEMCKGLDYAHKKTDTSGKSLGIVHRDISPSNILVSYNGEVKVADFGIASAENTLHETRAGVLKGKFEYMSPEQAQGKVLDARSDVFATGIILHEMLTGRRLFKTKSEIQTLEKIKAVAVDPPSAVNPNIPARLDEIVMRALGRDQTDRYQDCKSMQADLLDFMYPATPDLTQESLEHFLAELFADEITDERTRLNESTKSAHDLWQSTPEIDAPDPDWREPDRTGGDGTIQTPRARWVTFALLGVIVLLVGILAAGGGYVVTQGFGNQEGTGSGGTALTTLTCPPDRGCVTLLIHPDNGEESFPKGVIPHAFIDNVPIGTGESIFFNDVTPDKEVEILVEATGFESLKVTWDFRAGEMKVIPPIYLKPKVGQGSSTPAPASGIVVFETTPAGAQVFINDEYQGKTPLKWTDGFKGVKYKVRYVLKDYQTEEFEVEYPKTSVSVEAARTLSVQKGDKKGRAAITVQCGPTWGQVFLDGHKVAEQTPATITVDEGPHVIATKNPHSGNGSEERITVKAGVGQRVMLSCK